MESMADLLDLGRRAEKQAKGGHLKSEGKDRNALAVILDKRSGGTREWRSQWSDDPAGRLRTDMKLLGRERDSARKDTSKPRKRLSVRKVHQIAAILRRLPAPGDCTEQQDAPGFKRVLDAEVGRALKRSEGDEDKLTLEDVGLPLDGASYTDNRKAVADWIDRMLIARAFAESEPRPKS